MHRLIAAFLAVAFTAGSATIARIWTPGPAQEAAVTVNSTPPAAPQPAPPIAAQQGPGAYTLVGYDDNYAPGTMANLPLFADNSPDSWSGTSLHGAGPLEIGINGVPGPSPKRGRARLYLSCPLIAPGGVPVAQGSPEAWSLVVTDGNYIPQGVFVAQYTATSSVAWDRRSPLVLTLAQVNTKLLGLVVPATVTVR